MNTVIRQKTDRKVKTQHKCKKGKKINTGKSTDTIVEPWSLRRPTDDKQSVTGEAGYVNTGLGAGGQGIVTFLFIYPARSRRRIAVDRMWRHVAVHCSANETQRDHRDAGPSPWRLFPWQRRHLPHLRVDCTANRTGRELRVIGMTYAPSHMTCSPLCSLIHSLVYLQPLAQVLCCFSYRK